MTNEAEIEVSSPSQRIVIPLLNRALAQGTFGSDDMLKILKSGREWDWTNKGDFQGYGGRGGAMKICNLVTIEFQDETGISMKTLYRKIMGAK